MILRDGSKLFIPSKILQWMDAILTALFPDFSGELDSTIIGVVYLSFTNFIFVACFIMRSRMSVFYGLSLARDAVLESASSSSGSSSNGCMVWSSLVGVFEKITIFSLTFERKCLKSSQLVQELRLMISNDLVMRES